MKWHDTTKVLKYVESIGNPSDSLHSEVVEILKREIQILEERSERKRRNFSKPCDY